jgi:hypothetical protein
MKFTANDGYEIIGTDITLRTLNAAVYWVQAAENERVIIPMNLMWHT